MQLVVFNLDLFILYVYHHFSSSTNHLMEFPIFLRVQSDKQVFSNKPYVIVNYVRSSITLKHNPKFQCTASLWGKQLHETDCPSDSSRFKCIPDEHLII